MFEFWRKIFTAKDIRTRVLARGVGLTVIPLVAVLLVIWSTNWLANSVSVDGYSRLANQDSNRVVMGLVSTCRLYDGYLSGAVNGARALLNRTGAVHYDVAETITWQAKNQVTAKLTPVSLPLMKVGETSIRPVADFSRQAPIVDEVEALYQFSATVFQRMNAQGDMLRVSTNVKKADGSRAIGTFIPAVGADGKLSPVIATVLRGQTYLGRAFVVNSWYIAAYMPLKDANGSITGMIYTGTPEALVRDKILQFTKLSSGGDNTDVFIVHTAGKDHGLFVLSNDPGLQDHMAWNYRDGHGNLYVQDICKKAISNKDSISEASYWSQPRPGRPSEKILVRFVYFPAWDWVIAVQQPEREYMATLSKIRRIFFVSNSLPLLMVVVAAVLALIIWNRLTRQMNDQIVAVMTKLQSSSEQAAHAIQAIGGNANSVGEAADELSRSTTLQASSAEETSITTSLITNAAKKNSETAELMLSLATGAEGLVGGAKKTMNDVSGAMQAILATNDEALSIIDAINEISFATNIVALNASIEAAKAGEAGRTFVFIADEVRDLSAKVASAVQQTRKIITNSREQMHRGTELVAKLNLALDPMKENANQVRQLAGDVTTTSMHQAKDMAQVLTAMEGMQSSTKQTAQSAMQSRKDAADLRAQVAALASSARTIDQAVNKLNEEFLAAAHPPALTTHEQPLKGGQTTDFVKA